jgi:hypothetical protein
LFDALAPLLEIGGYAIVASAGGLGLLYWPYLLLAAATPILFGTGVALSAVMLSDFATQRYMRGRDLALLVAVAVLENCGYRQVNSWWSCVATAKALGQPPGWGVVKRSAFEA